MMMKVQNLGFDINGKALLQDMSFEVPEGSLFVILGPNGAGKTLLLRCLAGLAKPTRGAITQMETSSAWVPLSQSLPFGFRVFDLVLMGRYAIHQGFPQKADHSAALQAMVRTGVDGFADRTYNSLSRGEQTKVDIARALASDAKLILLDEPFSNLDIDSALQMIRLFRDLTQEGRTLVLSHHDLYTVHALATHALLMKSGQVLKNGTMREVFQAPLIEQAYNVRVEFHQKDGQDFVRFDSLSPR